MNGLATGLGAIVLAAGMAGCGDGTSPTMPETKADPWQSWQRPTQYSVEIKAVSKASGTTLTDWDAVRIDYREIIVGRTEKIETGCALVRDDGQIYMEYTSGLKKEELKGVNENGHCLLIFNPFPSGCDAYLAFAKGHKVKVEYLAGFGGPTGMNRWKGGCMANNEIDESKVLFRQDLGLEYRVE